MKDQNANPPVSLPEDEGNISAGRGEILLYQTEDGRTRVECRFQDETIWLSQALMAELYQTSKQNISLHLQNLCEEAELDANQRCRAFKEAQGEQDTIKALEDAAWNLPARTSNDDEEGSPSPGSANT